MKRFLDLNKFLAVFALFSSTLVEGRISQTETLSVTQSAAVSVTLAGTASDDGLPSPSLLVIQWEKISGPGTVQFANVADPRTSATFSKPGHYVLRLRASDGALESFDDVNIDIVKER
jgi:hypothetical protein